MRQAPDNAAFAAAAFSIKDITIQDLVFAAATVTAISGMNLGDTSIPVFVVFIFLSVLLNTKDILTPIAPVFVIPPLIIFLIIHVTSALKGGTGAAAFYLAQAFILITFVWLFVARYAVRPMNGYLTASGLGLLGLLVYVAGWHITHGFYFSWKRLSDAKAVFDVLPLMLVIAARSSNLLTRRLFPLLAVFFIIAIFISGERKAYILLVLISPLLLNLRNPVTYVLPFLLILSAPVIVSLEKSGYVARQIETLQGFAEGRVVRTISNEGRSAAADVAIRTFKSHPILGVGTNQSLALVRRYDRTMAAPHNEWLRVAAENGIVGLFFYGATVLWGVLGAFRPTVLGRSRSSNERAVAFAFAAMLLIYFSLEAFDFIVLLAFMMLPFVQYLRLDPGIGLAPAAAPRVPSGAPRQRPALNANLSGGT